MRDFDQLLKSIRSMIEIARNQTAATATRIYERFSGFVSLRKWEHESLDQNVLCTDIAIGCEIDTQPRARCTGDHPA